MKLAVSFTNFGPYHLARLRALAEALGRRGDELIAYETAGSERKYPWSRPSSSEPFEWVTLFPDRELEGLSRLACRWAMDKALDEDRPDALGIVGYARPESMAMLAWARRRGRPTVLMSESQEIDHPRIWWKEAVKRRRVPKFSAALVGGPSHADYLTRLGLPMVRISFGYNAVDNAHFARLADAARSSPDDRDRLPIAPYFIAVSRFVPEKNLIGLVAAFSRYRRLAGEHPWDLVLCGSGPGQGAVDAAIESCGLGPAIHRPGFSQAEDLAGWLAHASAFVHPSLMEPWGLVANEAAACGLPLLISDRAGCSESLVPDPIGSTGRRFDPGSTADIAGALGWMAGLDAEARRAMGRRASLVVGAWGPERFARGMLEAIGLAYEHERRGRRTITRACPSPGAAR